jgi:predicted hotdog family 3-hydroxylacyl-ACP dehydratase
MNLSGENTLALIPQKPPFVMIDALLFSDEKRTVSRFRIPEGNIFVKEGLFREPGLVENIAQTAAARAGHEAASRNIPVTVGYIAAIKNLEIFSLPKVNDELETEIIIQNQVFQVTVLKGMTKCGETVLALCEMKIFLTHNYIN